MLHLGNNPAYDPITYHWGVGNGQGNVYFLTPRVHLISPRGRYIILHKLVRVLLPGAQFAHIRQQLQDILALQIQALRSYGNDVIEDEAPHGYDQLGGMQLS